MKIRKQMFLGLGLAVLLLAASTAPAFAAVAHGMCGLPGEPACPGSADQQQSSVTSNVAAAAASASVGAMSSQISGMSGGGGFGSGGTGGGFGSGGTGGTGGSGNSGRSSGNGPEGIGIWALGGGTYLDSTKSGGRYDGPLANGMVGVDKQLGKLLVGLGLGYERLDLTTKYNGGKIEYDGVSLVPYLSYGIAPDLYVDASFGYTWLDYTMKDTLAGVKASDSMDAYRMVTAANLTKYLAWDKLLVSGRVGAMYLNEQQGDYVLNGTYHGNSRVYTLQGSLAARAMYDMGQWRPAAGITYMQDFVKSGGRHNDMIGADFDLGVTYMPTNSLSLGLTGVFGVRESLTKLGASLNIRYDF